MGKNKNKNKKPAAPAADGGASLGGPPAAGAALGGPPAGGSALGAPPAAGSALGAPPAAAGSGSALGAPPPSGASVGAPPAAGSSLGSPAAAGSSLGAPAATGSALGAPAAGAGLGAPAPSAGAGLGAPTSLGGAPAAGAALGAPAGTALGGAAGGESSAAKKKRKKQQQKAKAQEESAAPGGAALGAPATSLGAPATALGGPPATALGGPPAAAAGASLGGAALGGAPGAAGTALGASTGSDDASGGGNKAKKRKQKKKPAKEAAPEPKKGGNKMSKIAAMIKKQQEEEERLRLEEERLAKEEEERLARVEQEREQEKVRQREVKKQNKEKSKVAAKMAQQREQIAKLKAAGFVLPPALKKLDDELNGVQRDESELSDPKQAAKEAAQRRKKAEEAKRKRRQEEEARAKAEAEKEEEEDIADDWDAMYDSEGEEDPQATTKAAEKAAEEKAAEEARLAEEQASNAASTIQEGEMRSPICCVLGHVDTGKTLLLDKIRRSNVQRGEAGGITQQIGATYFPLDAIKNLTGTLNETLNLEYKVPGLLIIDTPGHESFTNLRSRGSSLCDIAVLVVDINHGIEQQTEESLKLLKRRQTPFIVALNKIDRVFEWEAQKDAPIRTSLAKQPKHVIKQFDAMLDSMLVQFAERGFNAVPYYKNKDFRKNLSIVPTSAVTGEGIPDLLMLLVQLTQRMMTEKLYLSPTLRCTVLEIKVVEGLGTTADVIISDGILHEGDTIVLCGRNGPIVTTIRALLTPPAMREIRVKAGKANPYVHCKTIKAAMGVKIVAHDLADVVAGSQLLSVGEDDDIDALKEEVQQDLKKFQKAVATTARGVFVQASTLGSLEALLSFLKDEKIPVAAIGLGPIHKRDVTRASVMLEHDKKYAAILAFDVKIEREAEKLAEKLGVRIFAAPIIYHLSDMFVKHLTEIEEERRRKFAGEAVWPVILEIMPEHIFNKKDPLIFGATVIEGTLRINTPLCAIKDTENLYLGRVTSIEDNRTPVEEATVGAKVAIKIAPEDYAYAYERHFTHEHPLMSRITRHSLDRLKEFFGKQLTKRDVRLLKDMKTIFNVED